MTPDRCCMIDTNVMVLSSESSRKVLLCPTTITFRESSSGKGDQIFLQAGPEISVNLRPKSFNIVETRGRNAHSCGYC